MPSALKPNEVWSMNFLTDALVDRRRFRMLRIVEDFSRLYPGVLAQHSIPSVAVTGFIDQISLLYGYPQRIRVATGRSSPLVHFTDGLP
jgi:putative transposase